MNEGEQMKSGNLSRYAYAAIALFLLWLVLTSTIFWQELLTGLVFSLIIAAVAYGSFNEKGMGNLSPRRIVYAMGYAPFFLWEVIKANFDVAYRVLHPDMPINPGIVEIRTTMKSDIGKLGLANSITLTPGTITMDVDGDRMFIHWINVETDDVEGASMAIGRKFERWLKGIFE
jgi:multicomponent Na+:H+ antiporter subunit E